MCVDHQAPRGRYRGRRRAPTPPRSRYAAVVTTAVVGAGIVALGSQSMPDLKGQADLGALDASSASTVSAAGGSGGGHGASGIDASARGKQAAGRSTRSQPRESTQMVVSQQPGQDLWQLPVKGNYTISSLFGPRWGVLHPGIDFAVPQGTPIYAANAGKVIVCRWNGGYGYNVMIEHDDGVVSVYGHNSRLVCKEGQQVRAGDLISYSGNTGYSTGPHLHFELRRDNKPFDGMPFMREHGVDMMKHIEVIRGGVIDPLS
jgi:murein DD-endopeptidase MepM/ murein hydrolase activator NlpD